MKLFGNIVCSIAILTQIILSAGLLSHAPDCNSIQPSSDTDTVSDLNSHHCGCDHDHVAEVTTSETNALCNATPPLPLHDCTCSPQKTSPYLLNDQIVDTKSKHQLIENGALASTHVDLSQFSLLLAKANQSNAPPLAREIVYLPQHHARFTSIYLGVFTI
ncbi:MAG: hypothetical protein ACSHX6_08290 [Akkermansiaceae bacterium]